MTIGSGTNTITLTASGHSSISNINLYTNRAEVTRAFRFEIEPGQNAVKITGLPSLADENTVRYGFMLVFGATPLKRVNSMEGKGPATIHEVSVSTAAPTKRLEPVDPSILASLRAREASVSAAIKRSEKAEKALEDYMKGITPNRVQAIQLPRVMDLYEKEAGRLQEMRAELEKSLKDIEWNIILEEQRLNPHFLDFNSRLKTVVDVNLYGESKGRVELMVTYGVHRVHVSGYQYTYFFYFKAVNNASWTAGYDIRAEVAEKEPSIRLIYRAAITQNTGEDWNHASISLETATPTFGLEIPSLSTWALRVHRPTPMPTMTGYASNAMTIAQSIYVVHHDADMTPRSLNEDVVMELPPAYLPGSAAPPPRMTHRAVGVTSSGNVTATFKIPGLTNIPSDNTAHSVVIAELELKSLMSWACVPKKDERVHLKAKITNSSDYTLLSGPASVYVNGSFIAKSKVPLVSPDESFECSLGLDPSIRVTYHPRIRKATQLGFYNKSSTQLYTQRLTVFNSKQVPVTNLKLLDHYPVSEHQDIVVKLISPPLTLPEKQTNGTVQIASPPKIADGVIAQWNGVDEEDVDLANLGKDGMFSWICAIPSQGKVNLLLQWEVRTPADVAHVMIKGL
ncbi:hypothetical protein AX16_006080 [Volvariella volvacea WC 439]|nr:hypothetical protein AX16_006080 [Volvariella volvacea WC 439]